MSWADRMRSKRKAWFSMAALNLRIAQARNNAELLKNKAFLNKGGVKGEKLMPKCNTRRRIFPLTPFAVDGARRSHVLV